jgi:hypothetical protein
MDWLQAAAQDAANSSASGSAAFPDQVLVSRAAGYAPTPPHYPLLYFDTLVLRLFRVVFCGVKMFMLGNVAVPNVSPWLASESLTKRCEIDVVCN